MVKKREIDKIDAARTEAFFNLADAQVAITIKNTMGLAKAAAVLGIPRPTLMAAIMRLERKLDSQLFYRKQGSGEVIVTEYGKIALPHLERMLWIYAQLQENKHFGSNKKNVGVIGIVSTQSLLEAFIAPYLSQFIGDNPEISANIRQNDDVMVEKQRVNDIFIGTWSDHIDRYVYIPFHIFYLKLWASHKYLGLYGNPESLTDLRNHRFLMQKNVNLNEEFRIDSIIKELAPYLESLHIIDVAGPRMTDVLSELGLGLMVGSEENVRLLNLKVERVLPTIIGSGIEIFLRIDKTFMDTLLAKYTVDWIFKCRDEALKSVGIEPNVTYIPFFGHEEPK